jgi:hypothetical protein
MYIRVDFRAKLFEKNFDDIFDEQSLPVKPEVNLKYI